MKGNREEKHQPLVKAYVYHPMCHWGVRWLLVAEEGEILVTWWEREIKKGFRLSMMGLHVEDHRLAMKTENQSEGIVEREGGRGREALLRFFKREKQ
ncbi:hypothetical protein SESBI_13396 [Sesbania bispinosa]|nr:hypothetical protein SESBI_13396 [Sesbania bispinosa]